MNVNRFINSTANHLSSHRLSPTHTFNRNEMTCSMICRNIRNKPFFCCLVGGIFFLLCLRLLLLPIEWYLDHSELKYIPYSAIKYKDCFQTSEELQRSVHLVPKIIHQTYKSRYPIPLDWEKATFMVHYYHPITAGWQYRFWNDSDIEEFFEKEYPWFLPTFHSYLYPIQRADAFRYFILYHYGGIYIDLDIGAKQSFNCLLDYPVILPQTKPFGFSNDFLVSIPKHPFYHQLIHSLPSFNFWFFLPFLTVLISTGPTFLTLNYYLMATSDILADIFILPQKLYSTPGKAILFHVIGNSWLNWDGEIIQWIWVTHYQLFRIIVMGIIGVLLSMGVGYGLAGLRSRNSSKIESMVKFQKEDDEQIVIV